MPRRTCSRELTVEDRRVKVSELILKGKTQREIAVLMGVSQPMISKDLAVVKQEWRDRRDTAIQTRVDRIIASFDLQRIEAWEAWEKSKVPTKTTSTTKESVLRGGKKVAAGDDEDNEDNEDEESNRKEGNKKRGRPAKYKKDEDGKLVLIKETIDEALKTGSGDVSFLNFIKSLDMDEAKLIGALKQDINVNQNNDNRTFQFDFTKLYRRPDNDDDIDDVEEQIRRVEELALPSGDKLLTQEPASVEPQPETLSDEEVERIMQRTLDGL